MTELWAQTQTTLWTVHVVEKALPEEKTFFPRLFSMQRTLQWSVPYLNTIYKGWKGQKWKKIHEKYYYWTWKHIDIVLS